MLLIPLQFRLRLKVPSGRYNVYFGRELLGQRRAINQYLDALSPRPLILLVNSALALSTTPCADIEDISQEAEAHSLCSATTRSQDK